MLVFLAKQWKIVSAVEHIGHSRKEGHFVAYSRQATSFLRHDDAHDPVVQDPIWNKVYVVCMELVE